MSDVTQIKFLNSDNKVSSVTFDDSVGKIFVTEPNGDEIDFINSTWNTDNIANSSIYNSVAKSTFNAFDPAKQLQYDISVKEAFSKEGVAAGQELIESINASVEDAATAARTRGAISRLNENRDIPRDPEGFFIGRYPLKQKELRNFDYLRITCYDYEPGLLNGDTANLFKIPDVDDRVKKRRGVVVLPIQSGISESNAVSFGEDTLNPIQTAGAAAAGGVINRIASMFGGDERAKTAAQTYMSTLSTSAKAALNSLDRGIITSFFAGQAVNANILGRGTGRTINNNLEALFNAPSLRSFNYAYLFTPREPREAREVKQIIRFFKKSMAPKRSTNRIFLKSPNVFKLKYTFRNGDSHPYLNNIKICALTGFTVDYTPGGSYTTYDDEDGVGDGSMTQYRVNMTFKEMTPIYNDDFFNDDEGKEGTGF